MPLTSNMVELDNLALKNFERNGDVWSWTFESFLLVESFSCWRLLETGAPDKLLCGPRDFDEEPDVLTAFLRYIPSHSLAVLAIDPFANRMHLAFKDDNDSSNPMKRLELYCMSAKHINWKITGEDFVSDDRENLLENL